jgi:alkanesulfonate monooxygenase SsuD/methylene tetrahydromethanopterin reductase-like flavin-dependent oxidoreductase (luciferase family)
MDRIAVAFSPLRDAPPRDILAWSRRAETLGFAGIFIPESFNDSLAYAQAVAAATERVAVGTGITNVYLRHPTLLAQQAAAVQEFSGGRLVLGLGVGHRAVNASLGIDMGDPLAKTREIIATLRSAWVKGPHQPRPQTPPKILAAALARPMIELAGELADGAIFNLFPLDRYLRALTMLHRGAARGGRDPQTLEVCHFTTAYLGDDRAACLHEAKRMLARYASLPFYGNMLAQCGFAKEVETVRGLMKQRDVARAEEAVSDEMADAVTLVGTPARCRERLRAYELAGATMCIVFPNPVGESRAAAVERALTALAPVAAPR